MKPPVVGSPKLNLHCCGVILTIQQKTGLFSSPERGHTCTDSPETVESQTNLLLMLMGVHYVSQKAYSDVLVNQNIFCFKDDNHIL